MNRTSFTDFFRLFKLLSSSYSRSLDSLEELSVKEFYFSAFYSSVITGVSLILYR